MNNYGYENLEEKEKLSSKELLNFWKNPINKSVRENNRPTHYLRGKKRSKYLKKLIDKYLLLNDSILEIGCNVGRNLNYLYNAGYFNLSGIEINTEAIELMKMNYPNMCKNNVIMNTSVEEVLPKIAEESYDLVFTMAVLEHIHYDNEFIFSDMTRIARRYIIIIEDEVTTWSERHFPRMYKKIFENNIWKQVYEINCKEIEILDDRYWVRVFAKR